MNILYIFISSFLCILCFPKFSLWWLSFVALIPFFFALENAKTSLKQICYGILWSIFFGCGMGYWVFSTLVNYYEVPFAKAVLFFILCLICPIILIYGIFTFFYRFLYRDSFFFYALVVPSIWVVAEYLKELIPFMIPWGEMGYALIPFSGFIQIADIVGGYGVTFIVVMINSLLWCFLHRMLTIRAPGGINKIWLPLILSLLFITTPVIYGKYKLDTINADIGRLYEENHDTHATLIQGNFSLKERWSGMGFYHRISRYLEMTGKGKNIGERVIVWPETTLNSSKKLNDELFMEMMRYIGKNSVLISGGLKQDSDTRDIYNCAYFISGQGHLTRYDKHILLPYSETSPFIDLLDTYYTAPSEFKAGKTPVSIKTPIGQVGTSICFEILYPGYVRQSVRDGAQYLVNISNDSWFGDSPMPYAHLDGARMRAIENRRFLLRASNSGISAIISPVGETIRQSRLFVQQRVDGKFVKLDRQSFYTKYGNLVLYGAVLMLLIALIQMIIKD